jgi:transposase
VLNGILWNVRTGTPWRDLPERYGPWKTAQDRLRRWAADGNWDETLAEVIVSDDTVGRLEAPDGATIDFDREAWLNLRYPTPVAFIRRQGSRCGDPANTFRF